MATTGGIDLWQRDVQGANFTLTDVGVIISQRGDIVAIGNGAVATIGTRSVCVGYNAIDHSQPYSTIIGPENDVTSDQGTVVGSRNSVASDHATIIGTENTQADSNDNCIQIGRLLTNESGPQNCINIGLLNTIRIDAENVFAFGTSIQSGNDWDQCLLMGNQIQAAALASVSTTVALGFNIDFTTTNGSNMIAIGSGITDVQKETINIGTTLSIGAASTKSMAIGTRLTLGASDTQAIVIGTDLTLGANSPNTILIGEGLTLDSNSGNSIIIGNTLNFAATTSFPNCTIVGSHTQILSPAGPHLIFSAGQSENSNSISTGVVRAILMSAGTSIIGKDSQDCIAIGYINSIGNAGGVGVISAVVIGAQLAIGDQASRAISIGDLNSIGDGSARAITMGSSLALGANSSRTILHGSDWTVAASSINSVLLGSLNASVGALSNSVVIGTAFDLQSTQFSVLIGAAQDLQICDYSVILGPNIDLSDTNGSHIILSACTGGPNVSVGVGATHSKFIGSDGSYVGKYCEFAILIGEHSTIGLDSGVVVGSANVTMIGNQNLIRDNSGEAVVLGYNLRINNINSDHNTLIGNNIVIGATLGGDNTFCTVLGSNSDIVGGNDQIAMYGYDLHMDTNSHAMLIAGASITVGAGCANSVVIGSANILTASSPRVMMLANNSILAGGSADTTFIGSTLGTSGALTRSIMLGYTNLWTAGNENVIIGSNITASGGAGTCSNSIVIGGDITLGTGGANQLAICASGDGDHAIIGANSAACILISSSATRIGAKSNYCTVVGRIARVAEAGITGSPEAVTFGNVVTIGDDCAGGIAIGANSTIGDGSPWGTILGYSGSIAAAAPWATCLGYDTTVSGQAGIAIGARAVAPAHYCVIGDPSEDREIRVFQIMSDAASGAFFEAYTNIGVGRTGIDVGLKVWDGINLSQVSAEAVPPAGARLLYILP